MNKIADLYFKLTLVVEEFLTIDIALRLQSGVDNNKILIDAHDFGGNYFALAHFLTVQAGFEKIGKTLLRGRNVGHKRKLKIE